MESSNYEIRINLASTIIYRALRPERVVFHFFKRIYARIRNQFPNLMGEVVLGPFRIDDRRKEILYNGRVLELLPTEYELLKFMVLNQGLVLSKTTIESFS